MDHWQRLEAAILGKQTDRVPVAMWRHYPDEDLDPDKLTAYMLAWQEKWDFDLLKFMPSGTYGVEDWQVGTTIHTLSKADYDALSTPAAVAPGA